MYVTDQNLSASAFCWVMFLRIAFNLLRIECYSKWKCICFLSVIGTDTIARGNNMYFNFAMPHFHRQFRTCGFAGDHCEIRWQGNNVLRGQSDMKRGTEFLQFLEVHIAVQTRYFLSECTEYIHSNWKITWPVILL